MKKYLYSALCLLAVMSCNKIAEPAFTETSADEVSFIATMDATKVALSQDGNVISAVWDEGDVIGVYSTGSKLGNFPYVASLPDAENKAVAKFIAESKSKAYHFAKDASYSAYWPYSNAAGSSPSAVQFSVPAAQEYSKTEAVKLVRDMSPMVSKPYVTASEEDATVKFSFTTIFPIVQLNVRLSDDAASKVPVKFFTLSGEAPLAGTVTADITGDTPVVTAVNGVNEIALDAGNVQLGSNSTVALHFVVLPGSFDNLKLRLLASDESHCEVALPAVTFKAGCNYVKDVVFQASDFVEPEPLKVVANSLTGKAGEPVSFTMTGAVGTVGFYSGERFHDYAFHDKDRVEVAPDIMNFWHGLSAGAQPNNTRVKLSSDFDGTMEETNILAATWTDITEHFSLATTIPGDKNPITSSLENYNLYMKDAGNYDISSHYDEAGKLYIGFFYHIEPFDAALNNSRTWSILTRLSVGEKYTMTQENITLVEGASYAGESSHCAWQTPKNDVPNYPAFRFFSTFKPTSERNAYAVINQPIKMTGGNLGPDKPISVKGSGDPLPATYSYTFAEPGVYNVVFIGTRTKLDGTEEVVKFEFTITVNE